MLITPKSLVTTAHTLTTHLINYTVPGYGSAPTTEKRQRSGNYKPAPGLGYMLLSDVLEFCELKFSEMGDKCLETSLNIKVPDSSKKCTCSI